MLEGLAADELPHYGSGRNGSNLGRLEHLDILEELQKGLRLAVGGRRLADAKQQRRRVVLEERKVVESRRVEDHIGVLLEGEYVLVFSASH